LSLCTHILYYSQLSLYHIYPIGTDPSVEPLDHFEAQALCRPTGL